MNSMTLKQSNHITFILPFNFNAKLISSIKFLAHKSQVNANSIMKSRVKMLPTIRNQKAILIKDLYRRLNDLTEANFVQKNIIKHLEIKKHTKNRRIGRKKGLSTSF